MSNLYIESRLQAIKDIAASSCTDEKDADNISAFCDEIYTEIKICKDKIIKELEDNQTIVFNLGGGKPVQSIDLEKSLEIVESIL